MSFFQLFEVCAFKSNFTLFFINKLFIAPDYIRKSQQLVLHGEKYEDDTCFNFHIYNLLRGKFVNRLNTEKSLSAKSEQMKKKKKEEKTKEIKQVRHDIGWHQVVQLDTHSLTLNKDAEPKKERILCVRATISIVKRFYAAHIVSIYSKNTFHQLSCHHLIKTIGSQYMFPR